MTSTTLGRQLSATAATVSRQEPWEGTIGSVRVLFGPGRLASIGDLARSMNAASVLVVTDAGLVAAGHAERAVASLETALDSVAVFSDARENPSEQDIDTATTFARRHEVDLIVALGGGSAMDTAKGVGFLLANEGRMTDYWGYGKAVRPLPPAVAIPTTAGTGSDAQSYALIAQAETQRKMACGDPSALFRAVLLDPETAVTAPRRVAATAGIDALSHAVESYVTLAGTEASTVLAAEAWELLTSHFESALQRDQASVAAMQLGAHLSGAAIEASMLGAAHAAANPLTARHRIVHGEAIALMLPWVVRFNSAGDDPYKELLAGGGAAVALRIESARREAGLAESIRQMGVEREDLPALARLAMQEWTAGFNPRTVTERDFLELYEQAY